jgi:TIGR03009 family protein
MRRIVRMLALSTAGTLAVSIAPAQTAAPKADRAATKAPAGTGIAQGKAPVQKGASARPPQAEGNQVIPPAPPDPAARAKMEDILKEWEAKSASTKTLDAEFTRIDYSGIWKDTTVYRGRALLKSPNLACLNLELIPEDRSDPKFHERIICTGKEVWHYEGEKRQIFVYPLAQEDRKRALEQGPLPFLFNMNAAEIKKRYELTFKKETAGSYQIQVLPRQAIDRDSFSQAVIVLNRATSLPDALYLYSPNGKDFQFFFFTKARPKIVNKVLDVSGSIATNAAVNDTNFLGGTKGWEKYKVVRNEPDAGNPQGAGQPTPRPQPAVGGGRAGQMPPRR